MPSHAMHPIQDLFLESFSSALQFDMHFYMHSYVDKNFIPVKSGCYRWQTAGMFGEAAMAEPWDVVGKVAMAGTHKAQEGASGWVRCSHWW
jgi:hypothetical protein